MEYFQKVALLLFNAVNICNANELGHDKKASNLLHMLKYHKMIMHFGIEKKVNIKKLNKVNRHTCRK